MTAAICKTCRVYDSTGQQQGTGLCRLEPPQYQGGQWVWPVCKDTDSCNEYLVKNPGSTRQK